MLKRLAFVLVAGFAMTAKAAAQPVTPLLLVGIVRERDGSAVPDGFVRAFDAGGSLIGASPTDRDGTYALTLAPGTVATRLEIRCRYCSTAQIRLTPATDVPPAFVDRDRALANRLPSPSDLRALPYGRASDLLGLVPYTLLTPSGISDRGLAGGRSIVVDDGAPIADAATRDDSSLGDFPNRYAQSLAVTDPLQAFRYGAHDAGGAFVLDTTSDHSAAAGDAGSSFDGNAFGIAGPIRAGAGTSGDAGVLAHRADIDVDAPEFGGQVRAGYALGETANTFGAGSSGARNLGLAHMSYATASRRYITSISGSFAEAGVMLAGGSTGVYRSQYANAAVDIAHPGPIALDASFSGTLQNARYSFARVYRPYELRGHIADETLALGARTQSRAGSIDAGLGLTDVAESGALSFAQLSGDRRALLPSLAGTLALGGGFTIDAGYADALDAPTLEDADATVRTPTAPRVQTFVLGRTAVTQAMLHYDDGARIRIESGVFRGVDGGFATNVLATGPAVSGWTSSIVWEVAPRFDVRAWSLSGNTSRSVVWTTYANPSGLRFDAIVRDEPATPNAPRGARFDVGTLVPLAANLSLAIGSVERPNGRTATFGLRIP